jgi:hypothetical protein
MLSGPAWDWGTIARAQQRLAGPSGREIFAARCQARAYLFAAGEIGLHEAVDVLQHDAEATGLVDELGQDEVQRILAEAFDVDIVPDISPGRHSTVSAVPAENLDPQQHGVANATLQAAEYLVRLDNPKGFEAWLLRHSPAERTEIIAHFNKRRRS